MAARAKVDTHVPQPLNDNVQASYTLPARFYTDTSVFEDEKDAIFYRCWHYLGHESWLRNPGDYKTLQIADERVFVILGDDDELRGFYNVCRHRAHQLLQGSGNTRRIVCPYHAWSYAHDGSLQHARNTDKMPAFDKTQFCLVPVQVEALGPLVFVNLDPDAPSLSSQVAGLADDIRRYIPDFDRFEVAEEASFGGNYIGANWKVVVDNFVECYHCPNAHPAFADLFDLSPYELVVGDLWSRQHGPIANPDNAAYPFDASSDVKQGVFWYIWPTTAIASLPGESNLQVFNMLPMGIDRTTFQGDWLSMQHESPDSPRRHYFMDVLGPEDAALCESVQLGLQSRSYNQGKFIIDPDDSGSGEHGVHHFHRLVLEALDEDG